MQHVSAFYVGCFYYLLKVVLYSWSVYFWLVECLVDGLGVRLYWRGELAQPLGVHTARAQNVILVCRYFRASTLLQLSGQLKLE